MGYSRNDLMRQSMAEAGKFLRSLNFNFIEPVDVFNIINDMSIELIFRPLDEADGFYIPKSPSRPRAGILLNSRRPLTRQRFSAAHELCHFIRKDPARIEFISDELLPIRKHKAQEEIFADFFASHFLMPPKLVTYFFRKLGLNKETLESKDIYRLSLCMRTSYEATCNQLFNLEFISVQQCQDIKKVTPKEIKQMWFDNLGNRDIWIVDYCMNNFLLFPTVEDKIKVKLTEIPSTGYIWDFDNKNNFLLSMEKSYLKFPERELLPGQAYERTFNFSVEHSGIGNLKIFLKRPWELGYEPIEVFNIHISSTDREFIGHYGIKQYLLAA